MATIKEFAERWDRMLSSGSIWVEAVEGTDAQLMDVNKEQLKHGTGSDGKPLPHYKKFVMPGGQLYGDAKTKMNPENGGRWDMNWTGYSLSTMSMALDGLKIHISSQGHARDWDMKLGGDIFGVYENSPLENYRKKFLYPLLVRLIKEQTGAK